MKVIKRDGRAVEYNSSKIEIAIEKANKEVSEASRASKEDIKGIIKYIEDLNKKRILVEDIQDIIEEKLMELKKYELAKRYIVYRYTRALVRKQNTTDETILGIIRNDNRESLFGKSNMTAAEQRNFIAGEVSRDLTKRLLLPDKIAKADEDGVLHFHHKDYFVHPIINSSVINISDMLENGTVINGKMVESPKSFLVACTVATQIIGVIASNQNGNQTIDMICFGKYLRKSYNKYKKQIEKEYGNKLSNEFIDKLAKEKVEVELKNGIQMIQYQLSTMEAITGRQPLVTLLLHIEENDEYIRENVMVIQEILRQKEEGIKGENGENIAPEYPELVYVLNGLNSEEESKYIDLTKMAINCAIKRGSPSFISVKKMKENVLAETGKENCICIEKDKEGNILCKTKFSQGIVSINLPQIAILSEGDEEKFWKLLEERLELCFEALMCRHYSLVGVQSSISPIHWKHGAISCLKDEQKIDGLLYGNNSTLDLGYLGIYETTKMIKGESQLEEEGNEFALKLMKYLRETVKKWQKETNIEFTLCGITQIEVAKKFVKIDKEKFGNIKGITDKENYTASYNVDEKISLEKQIELDTKFQKVTTGTNCLYFALNSSLTEGEALKLLTSSIFN